MKKAIIVLLGLILLLALAGCSSSSSVPNKYSQDIPATTSAPKTMTAPAAGGYSSARGSAGVAPAPMPTIVVTVPQAAPSVQYNGDAAFEANLPTDRMVIRTGNMQIVVDDISAAITGITKIAGTYGGYVVSSQQGKQNDRNIGNISVRVLAEDYDKALADIRVLSKSVTNESTNSQDVTEEYVDLDSKVSNLEATEAQLLKIMQAATKTEDVLAVQKMLTDIRGQIDQAKGRMQYLQRTSATSLIQVQLQEAVLSLKFSADKVSAASDEPIHFTAQITGGFPPYNYQWDFGDGNTSNDASPTHTYKSAGVYNVSLKVTDDKGYTNSVERYPYISVVQSWKPSNVATDAWNVFTAFGRGFINFLIYLGIFSPIWIVIGGIVALVIYRRRKKS